MPQALRLRLSKKRLTSEFCMGLRPTYMDETHLESMSFDGVDGYSSETTHESLGHLAVKLLKASANVERTLCRQRELLHWY